MRIRTLFIAWSSIASLLAATAAAADSNGCQSGCNPTAQQALVYIEQVASGNVAVGFQWGRWGGGNRAEVTQNESGNLFVGSQIGHGNEIVGVQNGGGVKAIVSQFGRHNQVDFDQPNGGRDIKVTQFGSRKGVTIRNDVVPAPGKVRHGTIIVNQY
jgi:hypothetical protein